MTVFPGNGKTSFRAPMLAPASLRTFNQIAAGAWQAAEASGALRSSRSDGSFVPLRRATTGGELAGYDWVIGPGDVDANGVAGPGLRETRPARCGCSPAPRRLRGSPFPRRRVRRLLAGRLSPHVTTAVARSARPRRAGHVLSAGARSSTSEPPLTSGPGTRALRGAAGCSSVSSRTPGCVAGRRRPPPAARPGCGSPRRRARPRVRGGRVEREEHVALSGPQHAVVEHPGRQRLGEADGERAAARRPPPGRHRRAQADASRGRTRRRRAAPSRPW